MRIISFAWTTSALLAGEKTVTRRNWKAKWALGFHAGDLVAAYDRDTRYGGRRVGTIRLTSDPVLESTLAAPPTDWRAEGFEYLQSRAIEVDGMLPYRLWTAWKLVPQQLWVVRFEMVERYSGADEWLAERGPKSYRARLSQPLLLEGVVP
jgi:hypothetical protein